MYVIRIKTPTSTVYVGGSTEGSRFSIVNRLFSAEEFPTYEDAEAALKDTEFTKRVEFEDESMPPPLLWRALGINNAKTSEQGILQIVRVYTEIVFSTSCDDGKIVRPSAPKLVSAGVRPYPE